MFQAFNTQSRKLNAPNVTSYDDDEAPIKIGIVYTGGGSQGAFEAGVSAAILPRLSEIGDICTMSGTSAGIVNAIAAGSGLNASGVDEAIKRLKETWDQVKSNGHLFSKHLRVMTDLFLPPDEKWPNLPKKPFLFPFNPIEIFQSFMPSYAAQFISKLAKNIVGDWTTEVQHGHVKIYGNTVLENKDAPGTFEHVLLSGEDLTPDGVGASANLRQLGVHIIYDTKNPKLSGRRAYDGAEAEHGPIDPHIQAGVTDLIMIILHDRRHNKLDEKGELKHADIHSVALDVAAADTPYPVRLHAIEIETLGGEIGGLAHMNDSSKLNTNAEFIDMLYKAGFEAGQKWLKENEDYIGLNSSYPFYQPALQQLSAAHYI